MNKFDLKRKDRLEKALAIIKEKGGVCFDATYNKCKDKILIQCKEKHKPWRNDPYRIIEGDWCRQCFFELNAKNTREKTYKQVLNYLLKIGSTIIENSYDYRNQKLHYYCNICGNTWTMEPTRLIENNLTCTHCKQIKRTKELLVRKGKKERIKKIEKSNKQHKKYLLKQKHELDNKRKLKEREAERKRKNQAKQQQIKELTYRKAYEYLCSFNCTIIENNENEFSEISWFCPNKHKWTDIPRNFVSIHNKHSWCKKCNRIIAIKKAHETRMSNSLKFAHEKAKTNEGTCSTIFYTRASQGFDFTCNRGHTFNLTYQQLNSGRQWCPICQQTILSRGESISREVIEQLTNLPFPLSRPVGLISPKTKRQLSLDMYNQETKIAFEYHGQGVHNNHRNTGRYSNPQKYQRTIEIDQEKMELCKSLGIKLVIIDGFDKYVSEKDVVDRIKSILNENNIEYSSKREITINSIKLCAEDLTKRVSEYCTQKNGNLINNIVPGMLYVIHVHCNKHNYTWETRPSSLLNQNKWCKYCAVDAKARKLSLSKDEMQLRIDKISHPEVLKLLSIDNPEYGVHSWATFNCAKHGDFKRRIDSILYPSRQDRSEYLGCPKCDDELNPSNYRRLNKRNITTAST